MLLPIDTVLLPSDDLNPRTAVYVDQLIEKLKITKEIASENAKQTQAVMKKDYDVKAQLPKYRIGDIVYLKQNKVPIGKARRLNRKFYITPYYIPKCLQYDTYKLRNFQTDKNLPAPVHANRLKLCSDPRNYRQN